MKVAAHDLAAAAVPRLRPTPIQRATLLALSSMVRIPLLEAFPQSTITASQPGMVTLTTPTVLVAIAVREAVVVDTVAAPTRTAMADASTRSTAAVRVS